MKRIKTKNKIKQHIDGNLYFVSREIIKFIDKGYNYVAIYQEQLFDIKKDSEGNDITTIIETYPQVSSEFSKEQIRTLFKTIKKDIVSTDNFDEKFNELQIDAMLIDTINQEENGRYGTKEWIKY